jgi:hypothetical protein
MRVTLAEELGGIDSVELSERPAPAPAAGHAVGAALRIIWTLDLSILTSAVITLTAPPTADERDRAGVLGSMIRV